MSTNVIVIGGRLTADAILKKIGEYDLLEFNIGFDVGYGQKKHPVFLKCKWWGKRGLSIQEYMIKGKAVHVAGSYDEEKWKDSQGMDRKCSVINVNDVHLGASSQRYNEGADGPDSQEPPMGAFEENITF